MTQSQSNTNPLHVGNNVLVRTRYGFYTGCISELDGAGVVLVEAARVDGGGLEVRSSALKVVSPVDGPIFVSRRALVDVVSWREPLPREAFDAYERSALAERAPAPEPLPDAPPANS